MITARTQQSSRPKAHALFKLNFCLRMAKENSFFARTEPHRYRPEYRRMRRESMQDARYWRALCSRLDTCSKA